MRIFLHGIIINNFLKIIKLFFIFEFKCFLKNAYHPLRYVNLKHISHEEILIIYGFVSNKLVEAIFLRKQLGERGLHQLQG